jgi:hypothetical protein
LIDEFARENRADSVLKLASLPREMVDAIFLKRGIDPASIAEAKEVIAGVAIPLTPAEALAYSFHEPFRQGRFGDGSYGVYYSALEEDTCIEEIRHHYQREFEQQRTGRFPHPRYYHLLTCDFAGVALVLTGHEDQYSDLVSPTDAGYPFCQNLASMARQDGVDALYSRSARAPAGTCVPVFTEASVTNPRSVSRLRFFAQNGQTEYEKL